MRGDDERTSHLFSYVSPEKRVPADHPLRAIRAMTERPQAETSRGGLLFGRWCSGPAEPGGPNIGTGKADFD
jgi:hypothetical protein